MGCSSSKSTHQDAKPKLAHSKSTLEASSAAAMNMSSLDKPPGYTQDTDTTGTVSTADNTDDAPCVVLSEYNDDNYCTVTRVIRSGPGRIAVDFVAVGNGFLGSKLPDPMNSILSWPSGSTKPTSHVYERQDPQYISGTLHFSLDEDNYMFYYLSGELMFSYGCDGFSAAAIIVQGAGAEAGAQVWLKSHKAENGLPAHGQLPRVSEGGESSPESQTLEDLNADRGVLLLPREEPHVPSSNAAAIPGATDNSDAADDVEQRDSDTDNHASSGHASRDATVSQSGAADKPAAVTEAPASIIVRAGPETAHPDCCRGFCCPHSAAALAPVNASA